MEETAAATSSVKQDGDQRRFTPPFLPDDVVSPYCGAITHEEANNEARVGHHGGGRSTLPVELNHYVGMFYELNFGLRPESRMSEGRRSSATAVPASENPSSTEAPLPSLDSRHSTRAGPAEGMDDVLDPAPSLEQSGISLRGCPPPPPVPTTHRRGNLPVTLSLPVALMNPCRALSLSSPLNPSFPPAAPPPPPLPLPPPPPAFSRLASKSQWRSYLHEVQRTVSNPSSTPSEREAAVSTLIANADRLYELASGLCNSVEVAALPLSLPASVSTRAGSEPRASGSFSEITVVQPDDSLPGGDRERVLSVTMDDDLAVSSIATSRLAALGQSSTRAVLALTRADNGHGSGFMRVRRSNHTHTHDGTELINEYRVCHLLGSGTTGCVFLCVDCNTSVPYAIKSVAKPHKRSFGGLFGCRCSFESVSFTPDHPTATTAADGGGGGRSRPPSSTSAGSVLGGPAVPSAASIRGERVGPVTRQRLAPGRVLTSASSTRLRMLCSPSVPSDLPLSSPSPCATSSPLAPGRGAAAGGRGGGSTQATSALRLQVPSLMSPPSAGACVVMRGSEPSNEPISHGDGVVAENNTTSGSSVVGRRPMSLAPMPSAESCLADSCSNSGPWPSASISFGNVQGSRIQQQHQQQQRGMNEFPGFTFDRPGTSSMASVGPSSIAAASSFVGRVARGAASASIRSNMLVASAAALDVATLPAFGHNGGGGATTTTITTTTTTTTTTTATTTPCKGGGEQSQSPFDGEGSDHHGSSSSGKAVDVLYPVEREIRVLRRLRHPNIVGLHKVIDDEDEGVVHLLLDFVPSGPITTVQAFDPATGYASCEVVRPLSRLTLLCRQLIDAMLHLQRRCVVHNDLKPDNILLDEEGNVMLTDFGESVLLPQGLVKQDMNASVVAGNCSRWNILAQQSYGQGAASTTLPDSGDGWSREVASLDWVQSYRSLYAAAGTSEWAQPDSSMYLHTGVDHEGKLKGRLGAGTPAFCAPELIDRNECSFKTDVWSFGVILYSLIVGHLPFTGPTVRDTFNAVLHAELTFPPLEEVPHHEDFTPESYADWQGLCRRLLARSPAERMSLRILASHPLLRQTPALPPPRPAAKPPSPRLTDSPTGTADASPAFWMPRERLCERPSLSSELDMPHVDKTCSGQEIAEEVSLLISESTSSTPNITVPPSFVAVVPRVLQADADGGATATRQDAAALSDSSSSHLHHHHHHHHRSTTAAAVTSLDPLGSHGDGNGDDGGVRSGGERREGGPQATVHPLGPLSRCTTHSQRNRSAPSPFCDSVRASLVTGAEWRGGALGDGASAVAPVAAAEGDGQPLVASTGEEGQREGGVVDRSNSNALSDDGALNSSSGTLAFSPSSTAGNSRLSRGGVASFSRDGDSSSGDGEGRKRTFWRNSMKSVPLSREEGEAHDRNHRDSPAPAAPAVPEQPQLSRSRLGLDSGASSPILSPPTSGTSAMRGHFLSGKHPPNSPSLSQSSRRTSTRSDNQTTEQRSPVTARAPAAETSPVRRTASSLFTDSNSTSGRTTSRCHR